jgi:DNA modification methylase
LLGWWKRYSEDTLKRLSEFDKLRTNTFQKCFTGDSRTIDLEKELKNSDLANVYSKNKIKGIFTSPPYVGLINYHEQHAYAYDLFGFVSEVLNNCKKWLAEDFDIFIVANDKYNMYPIIAEKTGLRIVQQFKRPVLNRTEKDKNAYSESIFHLKEN